MRYPRSCLLAAAAALLLTAGPASEAFELPDGINVAVTLTFDLDAETVWWNDPEKMTGPPGPLSQGRYGPTVALPRILDLLARHDLKATFFVPSWVAASYPGAVRSIAAAGHEIGAHGVRHVPPNQLTPAEERKRLRESLETLAEISGRRPTGYRAPAWAISDATLELVADEGLAYSSNLMDSDVPYVHTEPGGLVELPVSWILDDAPHFWFDEESWNKTIVSAEAVGNLWREEFTAAHRSTGYFGLTLHPQFIGRPARLQMLDELLDWMKQHDGVWITDCRTLAAHVRAGNRAEATF